MADIFNVPNLNPDDFNQSSSSSSSGMDVFGGLEKVIEAINKTNEITQNILNAVVPTNQSISNTISNGSKSLSDEMVNANTLALKDLTQKISDAVVKHEISGTNSNFFMTFLSYSTNDKKIQKMDKFASVFGGMVEKISGLAKHSKSIDKLGQSLMTFFGSAKQIGKALALAGAGIAIFGLSLVTFIEAITVKDLIMFIGLMGAIRIGSMLMKDVKTNFLLASVGIALFGLAIWSFNELITTQVAFDFFTNITMVGAGAWAFSKLTKNISKNSKDMFLTALAISAVGGALWVFNKALANMDDFSLEVAIKTGVAVVVASKGLEFIGKGMVNIMKGALASVTVAGALWTLAKGVQEFVSVDIDSQKAGEMALASGLAIGVLGLIGASGPVAVAIMVGALASATVGGALWALAKGMDAVSKVNVTQEQGLNFGMSIGYVAKGIGTLGAYALQIGIGAPLGLLVAGSTLALAGALGVVNAMPMIDPMKIQNFSESVKLLMGVYDSSLGGFFKNIGKGMNSVLYTGIATVTILLATALKVATFMIPSKDSITSLVDSLGVFIDGIGDVFSGKEEKLKNIRLGIQSFVGVSKLTKDIADTVLELGNLQFVDKEYVNGQLVVKGTRKVTESDFAMVGTSIGRMLSALTDPLAQIGGANDTFSIGGFSITNPFSNKVQKGIEAMSGVGAVFMPLSEIMKTFAQNNNPQFVSNFNTSLSSLIGGMANAFVSNEESIKKANTIQIISTTNGIKTLSNIVSNDKFINNIPKFKEFSNDVLAVKNTLNDFDLTKITKFNMMLSHINEMAKNGAMKELVSVFQEFIEKFVEFTDKQQSTSFDFGFGGDKETQVNIPTKSLGSTKTGVDINSKTDTKTQPIDVSGLMDVMEKIRKMLQTGEAKFKMTNTNELNTNRNG